MPQNRLEPVVACVVQMVGLCRGEQNLVDLRPEQGRQQIAASHVKRGENIG
jgi:hypothetical protein